jgi:hypothetical protein
LRPPLPTGSTTTPGPSALSRAAWPAASRPASGLRWRELAGAGGLFLVLSFAVFGWYAFHGGFIADDWVNADHYYFHPDSGFWGAVHNYQTPSRPVAAFYVTLTYALLGTDFHAHLVLSVLLAAFLSTAFFAFLRTVGLARLWALAAAALLLVFPSSDSTRLWSTGSQIDLFIGLYLFAMVIAIAGIRRFGPRPTARAVLVQACASALAVAAVGGYEIVAPAVLLSVFLYWWAGGSRRGAVWRWAMDAVPTLLVLVFYTQKFGNGGAAHGTQLLTNVKLVAEGAIWVLGYTLYPSRALGPWPVFVGVAGLLFVVVLIRRIAVATPDRDSIVRWLRPLLLAIGGVVVGYLMLVPVVDRYPIYAPGIQNRTNCFAALGFSALTVFVMAAVAAMVVAALPRLSERRRARLRALLAGVLVLGIFGVSALRIRQDEEKWERAAEIQAAVLRQAHELVPAPPEGVTIFTSPYPGSVSPSVPIFGGGGDNDELGAFKVTYDAEELRAFPLLQGVELTCGRTISTPDAGNSETEYGEALLVNFRTGRIFRPRTRAECLRDQKPMEPFGPVNLSNQW